MSAYKTIINHILVFYDVPEDVKWHRAAAFHSLVACQAVAHIDFKRPILAPTIRQSNTYAIPYYTLLFCHRQFGWKSVHQNIEIVVALLTAWTSYSNSFRSHARFKHFCSYRLEFAAGWCFVHSLVLSILLLDLNKTQLYAKVYGRVSNGSAPLAHLLFTWWQCARVIKLLIWFIYWSSLYIE